MMNCYYCGEVAKTKCVFSRPACNKCDNKIMNRIKKEKLSFGKIVYPYRFRNGRCAICGKQLFDEWGYNTIHDVYTCINCDDVYSSKKIKLDDYEMFSNGYVILNI